MSVDWSPGAGVVWLFTLLLALAVVALLIELHARYRLRALLQAMSDEQLEDLYNYIGHLSTTESAEIAREHNRRFTRTST